MLDYGHTTKINAALLLRAVRKSFADVVAVNGLDLEVARAECFGLLGPNGAGKTTTIETSAQGLTAPDEGRVELLGLNWRSGASELRQRIGVPNCRKTQFPDEADGGRGAAALPELLSARDSGWKNRSSRHNWKRSAAQRRNALRRDRRQRLAMPCALVGDP